MTHTRWNALTPLPEAAPWLLEASAGTGKTYQLASLVLRLVGEYGLAIDRILAMTFTNAATSELRCRVRRRLAEAHADCSTRAPTKDTVLAYVRSRVDDDELARRFALALQSFDAAPISTIHGFSQRMLQELAFEAGHDRSLTLTESTSEIVEELVSDALAELWAKAGPAEVRILAALGIERSTLTRVANAALGAQRLEVQSAHGPLDGTSAPWSALLVDISTFCARLEAFATRFELHAASLAAAPASASIAAIFEAIAQKRFNGRVLRLDWATSSLETLVRWCASDGRVTTDATKGLARFCPEGLRRAWTSRDALESQSFWPFAVALEEIVADATRFYADVERYAGFVATVRPRVEATLARRRLLTFDGLIARLATRIDDEVASEGTSRLAGRLRGKFDAVLVDEFQDTDAAQWTVLREAFLGHRRLFLIGDPKQAIYSFRGANVHVYLEAARRIPDAQRCTMDTNWRSDETAIAAMNTLWRSGSQAFGTDALDYVTVQASEEHRERGVRPALDLRWIDAATLGGTPGAAVGSQRAATRVVASLAADAIVTLLAQEHLEVGPGATQAAAARVALTPESFAVLTATNAQAEAVRSELVARGVPAVCASKFSVFASDAAAWLACWLAAVASRGHGREVRALAVTPLVGWSGEHLARATEDPADRADSASRDAHAAAAAELEALIDHLRHLADRWPREGFGRLFDGDLLHFGAMPRVVGMPAGERHATDLRHLLELAHAHERRHRPSPLALAAWLDAARAETENVPQELVQRLESDARAVTIETVHVSKGLEYPVVLLPFAWLEPTRSDDTSPVKLQGSAATVLNVEGAGRARRQDLAARLREEEAREAQRKLYVALTRAEHCTLAWFGPVGEEGADLAHTALGRVALRDGATDGLLPAESLVAPYAKGGKAAPDAEAARTVLETVHRRLDALATASRGTIAWSVARRGAGALAPPPPRAPEAPLRAHAPWAPERGRLVSPWQTTSFTALTKAAMPDADAADAPILSADLPAGLVDEGASRHEVAARASAPGAPGGAPALRLTRAGGAAYGTFVHTVFERVDFTTCLPRDTDSWPTLHELVHDEARLADVSSDAADELIAALPAVLAAPLSTPQVALPPGFSLQTLRSTDRLDELAFDLRLGAGTRFSRDAHDALADDGTVSLDALFAALRACPDVLPAPWVRSFEQRLRSGRFARGLVGILRGAIDLVLRIEGPRGARYIVADYKTNRLPGDSLASYARSGLLAAMVDGDYLLQALLYTVAVHRELRVRLRDYDYDAHVGGFLYLFVRGMAAARAEGDVEPYGVYADRFPRSLVEAVDHALSARTFP